MESITTSSPVRVFLVGFSESFVRSLGRYVTCDARIALTGVAPSLDVAGTVLSATGCDVLLVDWSALKPSFRDVLGKLRSDDARLRIVVVVSEAEPYRASAVEAGADAVIARDRIAAELGPLLGSFYQASFAASGERCE